jgi:hypothetical protein
MLLWLVVLSLGVKGQNATVLSPSDSHDEPALLLSGGRAAAQEWQWSVPVEGGRTNAHARAWLWVPADCRRIRAVVLTQNNMEELSIVENPGFREKMAALGVAEVWVSPMFDHCFRFTEGAGDVFDRMMRELADSSGYTELLAAPVIGIGHSAAASWPYYFAAWAPERTLACISVSGQWPYFRDERFAPDIWPKGRNIDFIPCLETMGEYEEAGSVAIKGVKQRWEHPAMPLSMLACPAEGHFAASQEKIDYLALYIRKAMQYRLPPRPGASLRKIDPRHTGWLMERWRRDKSPEAPAAPVEKYKGDASQAFWFFDSEMVLATEKYEARYRGLKTPLVGYVQEGAAVRQQNTHLQVELRWLPEEDGISFSLRADFVDTVPGESPRPAMWTGLPVGSRVDHPAGAPAIRIERVAGPFERIDDTLFRLAFQKETPFFLRASDTVAPGRRRPLALTFAAVYPGNEVFRPAVQQAEMMAPAANTEGAEQEILFEPIPDQQGIATHQGRLDPYQRGASPLILHAVSSAGLPVRFCVVEGPVTIRGDSLLWNKLPPRARYPVKVTIAAWQYGSSAGPKIRSAAVVMRSFYIR